MEIRYVNESGEAIESPDWSKMAVQRVEVDWESDVETDHCRMLSEGEVRDRRAASADAEEAMQAGAAMRLYVRACASTLSDEDAASVSMLFERWAEGVEYAKDDVRRFDSRLWRCAQGHTSQDGWEPGNAPSLWYEIAYGADGILVWRRPGGAHDAPAKGDKRHYPDADGAVYVSMRDGNTSVPGTDQWWEAV